VNLYNAPILFVLKQILAWDVADSFLNTVHTFHNMTSMVRDIKGYYMIVLRYFSVIAATLLLLYGCVGGGDGDSASTDSAPTASTFEPMISSTGVNTNTEIKATFSEPVQFTSIIIAGEDDVALGGVTSGSGSNTAVFQPDQKLEYGTKYRVTITDVKDMSGVSLAQNNGSLAWTFTTLPPEFASRPIPSGSSNNEGQYNSIVHTQTHGTVIIYYNGSNESIKMLSTSDGGITFDEEVYYFSESDVEDDNVTLLADGSRYHILYLHKTKGLQYASIDVLDLKDGAVDEWATVTVDEDITGNAYASMVIDGSGFAHISYYDAANTALKYVTNDNATRDWISEIVDDGLAGDDPGQYSSIDIDENGTVYISYYDFHVSNNNGNLKLAFGTAANWNVSTIDTTGDVGRYPSLALYDGFVYVTYYDSDHQSIKLISNETGAWVSGEVVERVASATSCPLVIGDNGTKYISYFKHCGGDNSIDLCYGYMGPSTSIDIVVDDSGIENGVQLSHTFDQDRKAHISYYDSVDRDLKYAYNMAP
jgi:hypothetical protein